MADLGELILGLFTPVSNTAITGAEPVLQAIGSPDDAKNVHDTANTTHTGEASFALGDMPGDFGNMDTLSIQLRYGFDTAPSLNTWDSLRARVFKADGITPLTNQATVASSITATTPTNSSVIGFTGVDTAATKEEWDAAVVHVYFFISKTKGGDSAEERVYAASLTGTYTVAATIVSLAGASAGVAAVSGALSVERPLSGAVTGVAAVSGALTVEHPLAGSSAGVASVSGALTVTGGGEVSLAGVVTGSAGVTGELTVEHSLAGSSAGGSTVTGSLSVTRGLAGTVSGVAAVAGNLEMSLRLAGVSAGGATVTGELSLSIVLAGQSSGVAVVAGSLTVNLAGAVGVEQTVAFDLRGMAQQSFELEGAAEQSFTLSGMAEQAFDLEVV